MSHIIFDYLHESVLFNFENLENNFSKLSEDDLKRELIYYRTYVLNKRNEIVGESKSGNSITSVLPSVMDRSVISLNTLKQSSLYIHRYLIDDPIFKMTLSLEESHNSEVMNSYLGMDNENSIDRAKLKEELLYMKDLSFAVYSKYVKFIPASLIHKKPDNIPMKYSENRFEECTSQALRNYFYENSKILSVIRKDGKFLIPNEEVKEPCREIAIKLKNHTFSIPYLYMLFKSEIVDLDDKTGKCTMRQYIPKTKPSIEEFNSWVYQTLNQVADNFSTDISKDLMLCNDLNSIYFTESDFVSNLMKIENMTSRNYADKKCNTMNHILNYGVPIIEDISLNDILKIRNDYGESFEAFRNDLENKTSELRFIKDQEVLKSKISDLNYELKEGYLENVKTDIKKLSKNVIRSSSIIAGSLAWNLLTSEFNPLASLLALQQGYVTYKDYQESIKYNPSYFLWKVNKNKLFK